MQLKIQFFSPTNHISSAQEPYLTHGYGTRLSDHKPFL